MDMTCRDICRWKITKIDKISVLKLHVKSVMKIDFLHASKQILILLITLFTGHALQMQRCTPDFTLCKASGKTFDKQLKKCIVSEKI